MQVQVKLFASLREQLGFGEREVELAEGQTVDDLWAVISGRPEVPPDVLRAVNMDYVKETKSPSSHPLPAVKAGLATAARG